MNTHHKALVSMVVIAFCSGCADSRTQRPDDEAMMLYRDCMSGMPEQWSSNDMSAALGSEHVASVGASADSHREARQQRECMQRADWK